MTLTESMAWRAYECVMTRRCIDAFERREAFIRFHLSEIERLHRLHGDIVPVKLHRDTILEHAFGWTRSRGPS